MEVVWYPRSSGWKVDMMVAEMVCGMVESAAVKNRRIKICQTPWNADCNGFYRILRKLLMPVMNSDWIGSALEQRLDQIISVTLVN